MEEDDEKRNRRTQKNIKPMSKVKRHKKEVEENVEGERKD